MCRGSSLLNGVTPIVPPVRLSPHPRTKLLDGDWPPVVRRPRPSGARPAYRQAPSGRIRFSARGVAARAGEKLLRKRTFPGRFLRDVFAPQRARELADAPICQDKRLGCLRDVSAHAEVCHNTLVDFTGEEAFEAADDLASGQATTHRHTPVSWSDPVRQGGSCSQSS